ncbi:MAG: response regulator transcription factor [Candidatus Kapaibacteriales bacterium]
MNDNQKTDQLLQPVIAVVDDEADILELVELNLQKHNFQVRTFADASSFYKYLNSEFPDLILLDLMLPDADGMEICKYIKGNSNYKDIPIIILTAKGEESEKVLGLELGADDYVTKPFSPRELIARIKAVLRREFRESGPRSITIGKILKINLDMFEVYVEGKKIDLTTSEFKILKLLTSRKGWVFSRESILEYLGSSEKGVLDRTVDVHIKNLREKLGVAGSFIKNIRGFGYKISED